MLLSDVGLETVDRQKHSQIGSHLAVSRGSGQIVAIRVPCSMQIDPEEHDDLLEANKFACKMLLSQLYDMHPASSICKPYLRPAGIH
jgi:hypothetical protein